MTRFALGGRGWKSESSSSLPWPSSSSSRPIFPSRGCRDRSRGGRLGGACGRGRGGWRFRIGEVRRNEEVSSARIPASDSRALSLLLHRRRQHLTDLLGELFRGIVNEIGMACRRARVPVSEKLANLVKGETASSSGSGEVVPLMPISALSPSICSKNVDRLVSRWPRRGARDAEALHLSRSRTYQRHLLVHRGRAGAPPTGH